MGTVDYRNRKLALIFALLDDVKMVLFGRPSDLYVSPAVIDLLLISIYFYLLDESIFTNGYFHIGFPVICLLLLILNLCYIIHHLIFTNEIMVQESPKEKLQYKIRGA